MFLKNKSTNIFCFRSDNELDAVNPAQTSNGSSANPTDEEEFSPNLQEEVSIPSTSWSDLASAPTADTQLLEVLVQSQNGTNYLICICISI